jgi:hypothetical protein
LVAASSIAPASGSGTYFKGDFIVPSGGQYLYLIWDYRNSLALDLCYSSTATSDACCGCQEDSWQAQLCFSVSAPDICCNDC